MPRHLKRGKGGILIEFAHAGEQKKGGTAVFGFRGKVRRTVRTSEQGFGRLSISPNSDENRGRSNHAAPASPSASFGRWRGRPQDEIAPTNQTAEVPAAWRGNNSRLSIIGRTPGIGAQQHLRRRRGRGAARVDIPPLPASASVGRTASPRDESNVSLPFYARSADRRFLGFSLAKPIRRIPEREGSLARNKLGFVRWLAPRTEPLIPTGAGGLALGSLDFANRLFVAFNVRSQSPSPRRPSLDATCPRCGERPGMRPPNPVFLRRASADFPESRTTVRFFFSPAI